MPTLKVTVDERDRLDQETVDRIRAAEAGEHLVDAQPVLNVDSYETLSRILRAENLELLEAIAQEHPESIREAARLVDRGYRDVHQDLGELEDLGLIEFQGQELDQPKQPVVEFDSLEIEISLGADEEPVC